MDDYTTNRFLTDTDKEMIAELRANGPDRWNHYDGAAAQAADASDKRQPKPRKDPS